MDDTQAREIIRLANFVERSLYEVFQKASNLPHEGFSDDTWVDLVRELALSTTRRNAHNINPAVVKCVQHLESLAEAKTLSLEVGLNQLVSADTPSAGSAAAPDAAAPDAAAPAPAPAPAAPAAPTPFPTDIGIDSVEVDLFGDDDDGDDDGDEYVRLSSREVQGFFFDAIAQLRSLLMSAESSPNRHVRAVRMMARAEAYRRAADLLATYVGRRGGESAQRVRAELRSYLRENTGLQVVDSKELPN